MTQNDFLQPLFVLHPLIVVLTVLVFNFISLLVPAIVKKTVKSHLFNNPAFLIGDFFLLPLSSGSIALFYQLVTNPVAETTNPMWTTSAFIISIIFSIMHGLWYNFFHLRYIAWVLHAVFFVLFGYLIITFISKGFWQLIKGESSPILLAVWVVAVFAVLIHELLGKIWPKGLEPEATPPR